MHTEVELFVKCAARLGEGICWHPTREVLAWVDILEGRVFEHAAGRTSERTCGQMVGAIAPTADGGFIAALRDGLYRMKSGEASFPLLRAAPYDTTRFRFNDGKVDHQGRFWVGTLSLSGEEGTSALYRFDSGRFHLALAGVTISNGIAWAPDGRSMYYIDSPTRVVRRFDFDAEAGTVGGGETVISFGPEDGLPDGCAIDADGNLWVAHWGGGKLTQSNPRNGRLLRTVMLPVRNVTSCAFGGRKLDRIYISTAKNDDGVAEPLAGSVFVFDAGTTGAPVNLASVGSFSRL